MLRVVSLEDQLSGSVVRIRASSSGARSEVEAGTAVEAGGSHGMDVTLTQDDVLLALYFDLEPIFGIEQDVVAHLYRTYVGPNRDRFCPVEATGHLCRGRNQDARPGPPFAFGLADLDEDTIGQHVDGQRGGVAGRRIQRDIRRSGGHVCRLPQPHRYPDEQSHPWDWNKRFSQASGRGEREHRRRRGEPWLRPR